MEDGLHIPVEEFTVENLQTLEHGIDSWEEIAVDDAVLAWAAELTLPHGIEGVDHSAPDHGATEHGEAWA